MRQDILAHVRKLINRKTERDFEERSIDPALSTEPKDNHAEFITTFKSNFFSMPDSASEDEGDYQEYMSMAKSQRPVKSAQSLGKTN